MKYAALSMSGHRKTVRRVSVFLWGQYAIGKGLLAEAHEVIHLRNQAAPGHMHRCREFREFGAAPAV